MNEGRFIKNENQEPILTFEEFSRPWRYGIPTHNNFFRIFSGQWDTPAGSEDVSQELLEMKLRDPRYISYQRFRAENSQLDAELRQLVSDLDPAGNIKVFEQSLLSEKLYEAYKIMRGYGVSGRDLFM
ncbi:MAG: hypothetical protein WCV69_03740 [Patescibacteria group bacterium]|jgi:hypothetical protein